MPPEMRPYAAGIPETWGPLGPAERACGGPAPVPLPGTLWNAPDDPLGSEPGGKQAMRSSRLS